MAESEATRPLVPRSSNDRRALDLFALHGELSRSELVARTGLTKPTVVGVVQRLEDAGFIIPGSESADRRPGPRAQRYRLSPGLSRIAAVQVASRHISAVVADLAGERGATTSLVTDAQSDPADQILAAVRAACRASPFELDDLDTIVVGMHGIVDRRTGDLGFAWDLPTWGGRVIEGLRAQIGAAVTLMNDVHLAAVFEAAAGTGRGREEFALAWLGEGLGLASISRGRLFMGTSGAAGQLGYVPVPGAPMRPIRLDKGGFNADFQGLVGSESLRSLAADHGLWAESWSEALSRAVSSHADEFLDAVALRIATGLAAVVALMDPGLVVLSGETGFAGGAELARRVEAALLRYSPIPIRIETTAFSPDDLPALEGAIALAKSEARVRLWGSTPHL